MISFLRNIAIRKPFYSVSKKKNFFILIGWNIFVSSTCVFVFFTYEPTYTSPTLYYTHWLFTGLAVGSMVILTIVLNAWSKRVLTKQSRFSTMENEVEMRMRKRNKTAVAILNIISLIYALCILPLCCYYLVIGVLMSMYKGNEELLISVLMISTFMHLPLFPCSGLNALAYMLKDKRIKRYYKHKFCCERDIARSDNFQGTHCNSLTLTNLQKDSSTSDGKI